MTKAELVGYLTTIDVCSGYEKAKHYRLGRVYDSSHELACALEHASYQSMAVDLLCFLVKD